MSVSITIIPHEDHQQYSVNGHVVYKDSNGNYISRTDMSYNENTAFQKYKKLVIDNPAFKRHTKAVYKT
ncbi:hypothetical protein [Flavobacterium sp. UMI-01]|uniref:hypothetical protein n=1 Tax=Flavobacterium sp. UMI-01 TaxID=1441053 RepID=UPI001C7D8075|nr:hypothetical protein [Flavobacterium sp. UMI-01]GIZ10009.1 hypothetical protein FUMI01_27350 [Flavobacterium sp. UMI-01]